MATPYHRDPFTFKDYLKAILLGLGLFLLTFYIQKYVNRNGPERNLFSLLSNSCLAPTAVLLGGGVLSWIKKDGQFDVIFLGFRNMRNTFRGGFSQTLYEDRPQNLYDYRQEKEAERRVNMPWLLTGAGFLLLCIVFVILFYKVPL